MPMLLVLALSSLLAAQAAPGGKSDDILRGPEVPQDALKPDRARKPAVPEKMPKPAIEQQVFFAALESLKLDEPKRAKAAALRDEFIAAVAAYEKEADATRKAIFEKRKKSAEPGKPPSEEFKKAMEELEAKRPKVADLKAKLSALLSPEELDALRKAYEEGLKREREERTRREAEARRKKEEARKGAQGGSDDTMKPGAGSGG